MSVICTTHHSRLTLIGKGICQQEVSNLRLRRHRRNHASEVFMSPRYLCLQGHLWVYEDREVTTAQFCPTCGLRLYSESQAPSIPIHSQQFLRNEAKKGSGVISGPQNVPIQGSPEMTPDPFFVPPPLSNADIW